MNKLILFAAFALAQPVVAQPVISSASAEPSWKKAEAEIAERAKLPGAEARAKNVILFVGDGMGISTITAARIYAAQKAAKEAGAPPPGFEGGEESLLSFERLPGRALIKTYNTNAQVPDSAGTATAMTTGAKTRMGVLGMLPEQFADACATPDKLPATIARLARDRGMGVGIVTTTRITHATPAAMYAHTPQRNWEGADRYFPEKHRASGCADIASQLISFPGGMDVVLGGGLSRFRPTAQAGKRDDGRDLVAEWQKANRSGRFLNSARAIRGENPKQDGPVLGLFTPDHLSYNVDADRSKEPSLKEMTEFAIRKLQASKREGYVLMVEGGRIDHAHHMTNAYRALDETDQFSKAIEAALKLVDLKDTLVLVTADHSHVFTIAGYPARGNSILGFIRSVRDDQGRPIPTLGYANGPVADRVGDQQLGSDKSSDDPNFLQPKTFNLSSETHGGEDVALFAGGPGSGLASGTLEQNSIFHIMTTALGWK